MSEYQGEKKTEPELNSKQTSPNLSLSLSPSHLNCKSHVIFEEITRDFLKNREKNPPLGTGHLMVLVTSHGMLGAYLVVINIEFPIFISPCLKIEHIVRLL